MLNIAALDAGGALRDWQHPLLGQIIVNYPGGYLRGVRGAKVLGELLREVNGSVLPSGAPEAYVHESELPLQKIFYSHIH
jgi:hypothetical protein